MAEAPYNINSGAFLGNIGQFGKKAGSGIEKFGKRLAKPLAKNEAEQKKAANAAAREAEKNAAQKKKRAADTRWKNKQHQDTLKRNQDLADQRAANQRQLDAQRTEAAVDRTTKVAQAKKPAAKKPAAKKPATAAKPAATKAPKVGSDNLMKPVNPNPPKKSSTSKNPVVDTKAGDAYND
jgi:hypothetical protein